MGEFDFDVVSDLPENRRRPAAPEPSRPAAPPPSPPPPPRMKNPASVAGSGADPEPGRVRQTE